MAALRPSRRLARLALALVACVLAVGVPEGAMRAAGRAPTLARDELPADPDTLWALRPGAGRTLGRETYVNRLGLQGPEPAGSARRVLVTGDSSVFGVTVQGRRTFAEVLGERLGGVEVHNGGVPGYSSAQSLAQVRKVAGALDPALLVVANLWSDNNFDSFVDAEAMARAGSVGGRAAHLLAAGARRSAVLDALLRWRGADRQERVGWGLVGQETMGGHRRVPIPRYVANLEAMVATAPAVFVMLAGVEDLRAPDRAWSWDPYRAAMRAVAAKHGCPVLDVPALFRETGLAPTTLFVDEMHPTAEGHRRIGEAVATMVRERGWPERPVCGGGGPEVPVIDDPWTWEAGVAATAERPSVAGLVVGSTTTWPPLEVRLVRGGAVLDRVMLPTAAPYALQAPAGTGAAEVQVFLANGGRPIASASVDLAAGPRWGLDLAPREPAPVARMAPTQGPPPPGAPGRPLPPP